MKRTLLVVAVAIMLAGTGTAFARGGHGHHGGGWGWVAPVLIVGGAYAIGRYSTYNPPVYYVQQPCRYVEEAELDRNGRPVVLPNGQPATRTVKYC